jgi:hypothetical protein
MSEAASVLHAFGPLDSEGTAALNEARTSVAKYLRVNERKFDPTQLLYVLVNDLVERKALGAATRPVVHAVISGAQRRDELLRANGGVESSEATARRFGMTKQAVLTRAHHGTLLGLRTVKQNAVVFPLFQFGTDTDGLITGLGEVLRVLSEQPRLDGWAKCNFLLSPRDSLGGTTPLALLRDGHTRRVVNLARAYAQA